MRTRQHFFTMPFGNSDGQNYQLINRKYTIRLCYSKNKGKQHAVQSLKSYQKKERN